jgi:glycerol-3-phosphate dehydrogenase (NAD(P)+)
MKTRITVIGDGGWGTALAMVLAENGHDVTVWGPFEEYIQEIRSSGENHRFLPGAPLPDTITWTSDREQAVADTHHYVLAMPTKYFRTIMESFAPLVPAGAHMVSVAKGFDLETRERMTTIANDIFTGAHVAALSGPSHAEEVARGQPTAVVLASDEAPEMLQALFTNRMFRVYTTDDVIGVELGGALKNVVAVAAGICDGIGFGDNTRAALITRGLAEMTRFGMAMGAKEKTFSGLSGMGDLIVTCGSQHSRNRSAGERIGRGEALEDIMGSQQAVEGIWNCQIVNAIARDKGIDTPITDEVYAVVHQGKDPREAVTSLLSREYRPE